MRREAQKALLLLLVFSLATSAADKPPATARDHEGGRPLRPGELGWPVAWASYRPVKSLEEDIADLKSHGVGLISMGTRNVGECRRVLAIARRTGMKFHIDFPDITENAGLVRASKLEPVDALMIGGMYRDKAIDRHVFSLEPRKHEITMEPPVYNKGLPVHLHFAILTKTKTPLVQVIPVPTDAARVKMLKESVAAVWSAIQTGNYYPSPSPQNCAICPHRSRCPVFGGASSR